MKNAEDKKSTAVQYTKEELSAKVQKLRDNYAKRAEKLEKKFGLYVGSGSSRFAPVLAPSGATPVCNFIAGRAEEPPAFAVRTENSTSDGSRMTGGSPLLRGGLLLGLCDGFGCAGLTMELENLFELCNVKNYIAIEKNKAVRSVGKAANPPSERNPGINYGLEGVHDISCYEQQEADDHRREER